MQIFGNHIIPLRFKCASLFLSDSRCEQRLKFAWEGGGGTRSASWKACLRIFRDQTPLEFLARPPVELRSAFSLHLARSAKKLVGRNSHWLIRLGRSFSRGRGSFARPRAKLVLPRFSYRRFASFARRSASRFYSHCTSVTASYSHRNFGIILSYLVEKTWRNIVEFYCEKKTETRSTKACSLHNVFLLATLARQLANS